MIHLQATDSYILVAVTFSSESPFGCEESADEVTVYFVEGKPSFWFIHGDILHFSAEKD